MTIKPSLTTISYNRKASAEINHQLVHILGDQINITSYHHSQIRPQVKIKDDLVLITTPILQDIIVPKLETHCKYLIARRNIDFSKINLLLDIPPDTAILVVNNIYENALEAVKELEAVHLTDYRFTAYNPQQPPQTPYDYAVTFNEQHLVPQNIPHVIDLGSRLISLTTLTEILVILTGSSNCDNLITSRYISGLVTQSLALSKQVKHIEFLQAHLEMTLMNFDDGLMLTDEAMTITFCNDMVKKILDQNQPNGLNAKELLHIRDAQEFVNSGFTQIGDKTIHYAIKAFEASKNAPFFAITIQDLTNIQTIDEQYRKQKKREGHRAKYTFSNILHCSPLISGLIQKAQGLAATESTILLTGESGTGKELFAQSIHAASPRKNNPFVAINCAALSENLLESEFFGYEEGAFTGALKGGKRGLFEIAHTGTIFLDEIGDTSLNIQTKLLRVLQEKEIMRMGGSRIIPVDVRVVAATNQDLRKLVEKGTFRLDLFYRLNVLPLQIPPLRQRLEDVDILMSYYLSKYAALQSKPKPHLSGVIRQMLGNHPWYGNVRELENMAEYMVTISTTSLDLKRDIAEALKSYPSQAPFQPTAAAPVAPVAPAAWVTTPPRPALALAEEVIFSSPQLRQEAYLLLQLLAKLGGDKIYIGKNALRNQLAQKQIILSDQQIRTRLKALKDSGYLEIFAGKGTLITPKGLSKVAQLG